ncbi:glutamate-ammonia-ligase adenylyltransferase [Spirochaeta africana]|nr:glutamate-ammonia-ligase adenylyltransferase [Spirochaeta africana]
MSYAEQIRAELPDRYFHGFSAEEQQLHRSALEQLGPDGLVSVRVDPQPMGASGIDNGAGTGADNGAGVRITVIAFDVPGLFAVLAGTLAVMGCDITAGISCTTRPGSTDGFRRLESQRRRIIDAFSGSLAPGLDYEVWAVQFETRVRRVIERLSEDPQNTEVRSELVQSVAEVLADRSGARRAALPPVTASVEVLESGTRISITSADTPFFLYSAAGALSLHGVSIEGVEIHTRDGQVQDVFELVDRFGRPIRDKDELDHLRFSLVFTKQFTYQLTEAPDPFSALQRFDQLMQDLMRVSRDADMRDALTDPGLQEELARLLGASDFLWEDFIRRQQDQILPMLSRESRGRILSLDEARVGMELDEALEDVSDYDEQIDRLNEFKDREIFLIDIDHILHPDLDFFFLSRRLVRLAEEVIRVALELTYDAYVARYGVPRTAGGMAVPYAVFGLGKLGGEALGYASDLEVLCLYADAGETDGAEQISNRMFFERMFSDALRAIRARKEGIFQVDPRLRPHGEDGPLACTLDSFVSYYQRGGGAHSYERLALIRLRWIAGDRTIGTQVERLRDELVYQSDSIDLQEIRELRSKQLVHKSREERYNAKFSPGALVDIEYNVQILQVEHAASYPALRTPRLHEALKGLRRAGALQREEAQTLVDAYRFFRHLINGLRMLRGNALDLFLPDKQSVEFAHLARRMGYRGSGISPAEKLYVEFQQRSAEVRSIIERHLGRGAIPGDFVGNVLDLVLRSDVAEQEAEAFFAGRGFHEPLRAWKSIQALDGFASDGFRRLIVLAFDILVDQPDPDLALLHWRQLVERLDAGQHYATLASQPKRMEILFGLFGVSRFLSDILIQHPGFFDWVTEPATVARVRSLDELTSALRHDVETGLAQDPPVSARDSLRLFRKREMVRIGTRDLQIAVPLKYTLAEISNLAQAVVGVGVENVWQQRGRVAGAAPGSSAADPDNFCVLAFGKFGGGELNYSSDIDLVAIYRPSGDTRSELEQQEYTAVVRAIVAELNEYTSEGYAYRVDLRLRPFGASGDVVWSLPRILQYYRRDASLWEFQAMLKLRPVAGSLDLGEQFLYQVRQMLPGPDRKQEIVHTIKTMREEAVQQYRSKQLRLRPSTDAASRNQALAAALGELPSTDIKNGTGGIRDIEFLVQGLQLLNCCRSEEIMTGNTLEALRRLANAGVLPQDSAVALAEHYVFLRRLEHLLQIFEDRQVHGLPPDERALSRLARKCAGPQAGPVELLQLVAGHMVDVRRLYEDFLQ